MQLPNYTLISYLKVIRSFDAYLVKEYGDKFKPSELVRPVVEGYLNLLSEKSLSTRNTYRTGLKEMLASWHDWGDLPSSVLTLIRKEDIPRVPKEKKPKVINSHAQQQLAFNLENPSNVYERMISIIMEVGMRGAELLSLKQDCIFTDDEGSWYLKRLNLKYRNDHIVPISTKLAEIIIQQIQHAKDLELKTKLAK